MKLLRQFEGNRFLSQAQSKTYSDVNFVNGFARFLEALKHNNIIESEPKRIIVDGKHVWMDEVYTGGIRLETTKHPLVNDNAAGDITIVGSADDLSMFERLMEQHEVEYEGSVSARDIKLRYQYHDTLNPQLWEDDETLKPEIRKALTEAGEAFFSSLKLPELEVEDVTFTGSNANYNWTADSDIDLHLVVDFTKAKKKYGQLIEEYFVAKKSVFNELHNITIKGHDVEFYVQDMDETHTSTGVFSVENDEWIEKPEYKEPTVDDAAVKAKTADWMNKIDDVVNNCNKAEAVEKLMDKIRKLRQAGLDEAGEFSVENLAFKQLRYNGYLEKLANCKTRAFDRELSVEEEEWSNLL